jgi:hypothetical protein
MDDPPPFQHTRVLTPIHLAWTCRISALSLRKLQSMSSVHCFTRSRWLGHRGINGERNCISVTQQGSEVRACSGMSPDLSVPKTRSRSCRTLILVDQATENLPA